jgi:hypothetical protein
MAPWKAPWRHANNLGTLSDNKDVDVNSGTEKNSNSQGEHAKSNPSPDDIMSSTSTTHSVFSLTSNYVQSSTSISSSSPTIISTTGTKFLFSPSDSLVSSSLSSILQFACKPVIMTSSPEPTTSIATSLVSFVQIPYGTPSELLA